MVRRRLRILLALLLLPSTVLLGRLASLQLVPETVERYRQESQHRSYFYLPPERGRILARDGTVLAGNWPVHQIHCVHSRLDPLEEPLRILAEELQRLDPRAPGVEELTSLIAELGGLSRLRQLDDEELDGVGPPSGDENTDEPWILLVGNLTRDTARTLERRWRPWPGVFSVKQDPEDRGAFAVYFQASRALQMELTLERVARLLRKNKVPLDARQLEARRLAIVADQEECLQRELSASNRPKADQEAEPIPSNTGSKVRLRARENDLRQRYRQMSAILVTEVPLAVVTAIEYHPERFEGLACVDTSRRFYTLGEMAGTLLGWTQRLDTQDAQLKRLRADDLLLERIDDIEKFREQQPRRAARPTDLVGSSGLELSYDQDLRGAHGLRVLRRDRKGRPKELLTEIAPLRGDDVRTTLDPALQVLLHEELQKAALEWNAISASAVVLELPSGAVLASAGWPALDPNRLQGGGKTYLEELRGSLKERFTGIYLERPSTLGIYPGSTFKVITAAAALESSLPWEGEYSSAREYPCPPSSAQFAGLKCDVPGRHTPSGQVNLAQALQYSCNVYFYYLALQHIAPPDLVSTARAFGFGEPTGIDLPASRLQAGALRPAEGVENGFLARSYAIGQICVRATPLQVARAYGALALGGKELPTPYLVRPQPPRPLNLKNPETVPRIVDGLWRVAHSPGGTAYRLLRRFDAAMKTGTAEVEVKVDGELQKLNNAWLAGFAPHERPHIAFAVVLEKTTKHGADAAGPVVEKLLSYFEEADPGKFTVKRDEEDL